MSILLIYSCSIVGFASDTSEDLSIIDNELSSDDSLTDGDDSYDLLWRHESTSSNKGHDELVDYACELLDMTKNEKAIVKYSAIQVDVVYGSGGKMGKVRAFHGRGNYVANIRFVSNFLQHIRAGHSLNLSLVKAAKKFPEMINIDDETNAVFTHNTSGNSKNIKYADKNVDGLMMLNMIDAIKHAYDDMEKGKGLYNKEKFGNLSRKKRELVFLGLALHMIGDVYSHRTIIPAYTVSDGIKNSSATFGTKYADKFSTQDFAKYSGGGNLTELKKTVASYTAGANPFNFKNESLYGTNGEKYRCRELFIEAIKQGVAEFQDIYRFNTKRSDGTQLKYDDRYNFCKERYSDAKKACRRYATAIIENYFESCSNFITFNSGYIFPTDSHVKLNNFKNYTTNANLTTTEIVGFSTSASTLWSRHSTTKLV